MLFADMNGESFGVVACTEEVNSCGRVDYVTTLLLESDPRRIARATFDLGIVFVHTTRSSYPISGFLDVSSTTCEEDAERWPRATFSTSKTRKNSLDGGDIRLVLIVADLVAMMAACAQAQTAFGLWPVACCLANALHRHRPSIHAV